jgi:hypothetical protein
MSKLSNQVALTCTQCGRPMLLTFLETTIPDDNSELLLALARSISQAGKCPYCRKRDNYEKEKSDRGEFTDYRSRPIINFIPIPRDKYPKEKK